MAMNKSWREFYEFGSFLLHPEERLLVRDGRPAPLTPKAYHTLVVENRGRVEEELMKKGWPDAFVEESGLTRIEFAAKNTAKTPSILRTSFF
jgi:DNA-binding winged helix-turn-helix (wHTH) protein